MVHRIYPAELQLNKANASDTEAAFLDLNLSIHNDIVSAKIVTLGTASGYLVPGGTLGTWYLESLWVPE